VTSPGTATGLDHVGRFARAAERFADLVAAVDLGAPVPGCPGWTSYDVVTHLGNVHAWAATIVETGLEARLLDDAPRSHRARVVRDWYAGKAEDLYQVLRGTDPERPCWNFAFGAGVAGFWSRRQLHETTIHTLDLDSVSGGTTRVAPQVAADGVDEVLTVFLHRMHTRGHPATLTAPLCLVCEDTGNAWTLTPRVARSEPGQAVPVQPRGSAAEAAPALPDDGPPIVVDRRHPGADRVSAPAEVLYRALWKRGPSDALTRTGDLARIDAFLGSRLVP
jgi:uncharacterized protein (TIGR03083 family)